MKELVKYIVGNILEKDDYEVLEEIDGDRLVIKISTNSENAGMVIGKGGKTIKAIQSIARVKGRLENKKVFVDVVTP